MLPLLVFSCQREPALYGWLELGDGNRGKAEAGQWQGFGGKDGYAGDVRPKATKTTVAERSRRCLPGGRTLDWELRSTHAYE